MLIVAGDTRVADERPIVVYLPEAPPLLRFQIALQGATKRPSTPPHRPMATAKRSPGISSAARPPTAPASTRNGDFPAPCLLARLRPNLLYHAREMVEFEWDPRKAKRNLRKHHIAFREAATVFRDVLGITIYDPDHSEDEERFITIGTSTGGRLLIISHTHRHGKIRLINARELTRSERQAYEEENESRRR